MSAAAVITPPSQSFGENVAYHQGHPSNHRSGVSCRSGPDGCRSVYWRTGDQDSGPLQADFRHFTPGPMNARAFCRYNVSVYEAVESQLPYLIKSAAWIGEVRFVVVTYCMGAMSVRGQHRIRLGTSSAAFCLRLQHSPRRLAMQLKPIVDTAGR